MSVLVILACLGPAPDGCQSFRVSLEASVRQCVVVAAIPELARWSGQHPGFVIRGFRCEDGLPA